MAQRAALVRELASLRRNLTYPNWQADAAGLDPSNPHHFRSRTCLLGPSSKAASRQQRRGLTYAGWQDDFTKLDIHYPV
eukprot:5546347-Prymnesium_polylepis.1